MIEKTQARCTSTTNRRASSVRLATTRQKNYIRRLGGSVPKSLTVEEASRLIEYLKAQRKKYGS
jgi:hypothetical protein